ncbi:MAG: hypothetical protein Ct9H300mP22_4320 [Gammaproteobacteria bacterium]|nr:MAG: hypothetical protein Ct9H300mP22_4320 [Gammaproteobacteria bacterium]
MNIQGPSLIKVPEWIENPLGKYYLYFADHKGLYIRLAYADELQDPGIFMHQEVSKLSTPILRLFHPNK